MKISYNWLKEYLATDMSPAEVSHILTDIGLEVEGYETYESLKGGLKGVVIGHVLSAHRHPNADKLSVTTVDIGTGEPVQIVCGAPNVAQGQKVAVATVGTTLYMNDKELEIKKAKIRGENSEGMICAEDELGIGTNHDGIMVLPEHLIPGMPAAEYFGISNDTVFEIGLTPNRADAASHFGVARELAARLSLRQSVSLNAPDTSSFRIHHKNLTIPVEVEATDACMRYSGITLTNIKVAESPDWLKNRLKAIGLSPINNIVDITNFILHETGQPLHAFDAQKIKGQKVIVKTLPQDTAFVTLDGKERKLHAEDLMICNSDEGMCIAGVFGGLHSGITNETTSIFLESAWFHSVSIRKTSKRHALHTDASFRFERGTDPEMTITALKRAAILMCEIAGAEVSSDIIDVYPVKAAPAVVDVYWKNVDRLIGKSIDRDTIKKILKSVDIEVLAENEEGLKVQVALYRVDVRQEVDVIEEILRMYGYNNIEIGLSFTASLNIMSKPDKHYLQESLATTLSANGFNECINLSLSSAAYYTDLQQLKSDNSINMLNPLSNDLSTMRQTLLFGLLETALYNTNRKNASLKLYEFGNVYSLTKNSDLAKDTLKGYYEVPKLGLLITGNKTNQNWISKEEPSQFYFLKKFVNLVVEKFGLTKYEELNSENELLQYGLQYIALKGNRKIKLLDMGLVHKSICKKFDLENDVYFAEISVDALLECYTDEIHFVEAPKFPEVKRDLAMLIEKEVTFSQLKALALKFEKKLIRDINLIDVYEDEKFGNRKSYAVSFTLLDETKTLTDKQIDGVMNNLIRAFESELGATIRK